MSRSNGVVGTVLVSETDEVRVWHLAIPPRKRCAFHRHVLSFFWTYHSYGSARSYSEDGAVQDVRHIPGDTRHVTIPAGQYMLHSIENTGNTELLFTTVEYKKGGNAPLPIGPGSRLALSPA